MFAEAEKMAKIGFSHDIEEQSVEEFNRLAEELPGPKYALLEAMIRAFRAIPEDLQLLLVSPKPERRERVLQVLREMEIRPAPPGEAALAKRAETDAVVADATRTLQARRSTRGRQPHKAGGSG